MLKENKLKNKLNDGEAVIGTWSVLPSAAVIDVIASTGIDFIVIDSEHGPISFETAQLMTITCESRGVTPIIRVSGINQADILKALDIGVHGIQIPNILDYKDIEKIEEFSKYPPMGNRGFSPFTRAGDYSGSNGAKLVRESNENLLTIIHIESLDVIKNIDKILKYESLDIIFIGLFDLSKAIGKPGQINDPELISYLEQLTQKIIQAGKFVGTISTSPEQCEKFIKMGIQYITYGVDCNILKSAYSDIALINKN